jgi:ABC-2 type transport system ATP-binding protein
MSDPLVVDNLRKRLGRVQAVDGLSFRVESGEYLALLGPNGAGKTTTIRCIMGRLLPDSGTISVDGRPVRGREGRAPLGLVPQELALYADLTTRENFVAFGRFHGLRGKPLRERVDWALEWTGLVDRQHDLVGTFSGGMKRRVNIACGVLHRPRVLLLDEPTVGVDPQSRQRIFEMTAELTSLGTAIVLTTHQLDEAATWCHRIVIVDHGRVIADGTLHDLLVETVGLEQTARITLHEPLRKPLPIVDASDPLMVVTRLANVATDLPALLGQIAAAGGTIRDVRVQSPNLQDVFLNLTGRELRE